MPVYNERNAVLDFTEVTYADSTVLNELVHMRKHRLEHDLPAPVLVVSSAFSRVLSITRMQLLWPHYLTLREALGNSAVCDSRRLDLP